MIFQHHRFQIWNQSQHPYKHSPSDIAYSNPAFGDDVVNLEQTLDWLIKVLYPNVEADVATPGDLPLVGNTINDYRVVNDDGDGNPAGYRWEQREGDVAAKWYKIYDYDWSSDAIISAFLDKTQDQYVHLRGRDERDDTGAVLTGADGGQQIFGGASANTHLTLHANAGDGTGSQTGYVQFFDDARPYPGNTIDLGTAAERWDNIYANNLNMLTATLGEWYFEGNTVAMTIGNDFIFRASATPATILSFELQPHRKPLLSIRRMPNTHSPRTLLVQVL
jgi:hypothetical protein